MGKSELNEVESPHGETYLVCDGCAKAVEKGEARVVKHNKWVKDG